MELDKSKTVAFTGHRSFKMPNQSQEELLETTFNTIINLCQQGYDTFLTGMAQGFDMTAALAVLTAQVQFPKIKLIAVVPFIGQDSGFSIEDKAQYQVILGRASSKIIIAPHYQIGIFHRRNDFLIDNSSVLVACYNGSPGGTKYTVEKAHKANLTIINVVDL